MHARRLASSVLRGARCGASSAFSMIAGRETGTSCHPSPGSVPTLVAGLPTGLSPRFSALESTSFLPGWQGELLDIAEDQDFCGPWTLKTWFRLGELRIAETPAPCPLPPPPRPGPTDDTHTHALPPLSAFLTSTSPLVFTLQLPDFLLNVPRNPQSPSISSRERSFRAVVNALVLDERPRGWDDELAAAAAGARSGMCSLSSQYHPHPAASRCRPPCLAPTRPPSLLTSPQDISEDEDPRVGSARDNSTGGTVSKLNGDGSDSASVVSLLSTLVPVAVYASVCILIFWVLRRRLPRVYRPRTMLTSLLPQCVSLTPLAPEEGVCANAVKGSGVRRYRAPGSTG